MTCEPLNECAIASAVDAVTLAPFITFRPNPDTESVVYAMTPELALDIANGLLEALQRNRH